METPKQLIKNTFLYNEINNMSSEILSEFFRISSEADVLKEKRKRLIKRLHAIRRSYTQQLAVAAAVIQQETPIKRQRFWPVSTPHFYWEVDCQKNGDDFFKKHIRMNRSCFNNLSRFLKWPVADYDENVTKEKRIAIAMYTLGSKIALTDIGNLFGVSVDTIAKILQDFSTEVWRWLWPSYMKHFPLEEDKIDELVQGFEQIGIPQCLGVIDTCYIKVIPPEPQEGQAHQEGQDSMALMALVDANSDFVYVHVGSSGIYTPSDIYEHSQLKRQLHKTGDNKIEKFADVDVPLCIFGSAKFPLSRYLMKPYDSPQTPEKAVFNDRMTSCSRIACNAFAELFNRFRRLCYLVDNTTGQAAHLIRACCVLHNFLAEQNDTIDETYFNSAKHCRKFFDADGNIDVVDPSANTIRQAFATYFAAVTGAADPAKRLSDGEAAVKQELGDFLTAVGDVSSADDSQLLDSCVEN